MQEDVMKSESQLFDLIKVLPNPLNFKEPKSGKYVCANDLSARQVGLESAQQMVGLTVHDLDFSQSEWGNALAEKIAKMDYLVREKKAPVGDTATFLNHEILIHETVTKFPILGHRGNVLGIVTFNQELTQCLCHRSLYRLYKKICGKQAIEKLLHHLEVACWFFTLPTEMELLVLLERAAGNVDKEIAKAYDVSTRTIETHFVNLRTKLKGNTLPAIVSQLRNRSHAIAVV
jgi:DNA-binding CsgD family transcriptional regulator